MLSTLALQVSIHLKFDLRYALIPPLSLLYAHSVVKLQLLMEGKLKEKHFFAFSLLLLLLTLSLLYNVQKNDF